MAEELYNHIIELGIKEYMKAKKIDLIHLPQNVQRLEWIQVGEKLSKMWKQSYQKLVESNQVITDQKELELASKLLLSKTVACDGKSGNVEAYKNKLDKIVKSQRSQILLDKQNKLKQLKQRSQELCQQIEVKNKSLNSALERISTKIQSDIQDIKLVNKFQSNELIDNQKLAEFTKSQSMFQESLERCYKTQIKGEQQKEEQGNTKKLKQKDQDEKSQQNSKEQEQDKLGQINREISDHFQQFQKREMQSIQAKLLAIKYSTACKIIRNLENDKTTYNIIELKEKYENLNFMFLETLQNLPEKLNQLSSVQQLELQEIKGLSEDLKNRQSVLQKIYAMKTFIKMQKRRSLLVLIMLLSEENAIQNFYDQIFQTIGIIEDDNLNFQSRINLYQSHKAVDQKKQQLQEKRLTIDPRDELLMFAVKQLNIPIDSQQIIKFQQLTDKLSEKIDWIKNIERERKQQIFQQLKKSVQQQIFIQQSIKLDKIFNYLKEQQNLSFLEEEMGNCQNRILAFQNNLSNLQ